MSQKNQMWKEKMVEVKEAMMGARCQHKGMRQKNPMWKEKMVAVKCRHKAMWQHTAMMEV